MMAWWISSPTAPNCYRMTGSFDEYRLLIFPTVLGAGERLFPAGGPPVYLDCLSAEQSGAAILARYRKALG